MEDTGNQQGLSLVNIFNAFKKNIITMIYFLLSALLIGFVYTSMQVPKYSSSARLVSKVAINVTIESQISSTLNGENFLSSVVTTLANENINTLKGKQITKELLGGAISGSLLTANGVLYDISFVSEEKEIIVPILTIVRSELVNHLKNSPTLNTIGNNLDFNSNPTQPVSLATSKTRVFLIAGGLGFIFSAVVIFVRDVWKGSIYDKRDIFSENLIEFKIPKQYRRLTFKNFMSWPATPINISKALTDEDNNEALTNIQDSIISKVGFDNNVQLFYMATKKSIHEIFIDAYACNFVKNGKKVIVVDLTTSNETSLNLREEIRKNGPPKVENGVYAVVGVKDEQYPSSIVNNSNFLNYITELKKEYDFVIINAGAKIEQYEGVLSKVAYPIVNVYSGFTNKSDYRKFIDKLNNKNTITLIVD